MAAGQLDGRLYRLPMQADVGVLYYRQDLLQRGSLPGTLEQLEQLVKAQSPAVGYLWQGSRYEGLVANFVEVLAGLGGTWIDPTTGKATLDAPLSMGH